MVYYVATADISRDDVVVQTSYLKQHENGVMGIDLNNMSRWELDHMRVAPGFTATYTVQDDENIATIVITRTGKNDTAGGRYSGFHAHSHLGTQDGLHLRKRHEERKAGLYL